jgi:hypothetical protein
MDFLELGQPLRVDMDYGLPRPSVPQKVRDLQSKLVAVVKNKLKCPEQLWNAPINLDTPGQVDQVEEDMRSRVAELAARTVTTWGLSHWIDEIEKTGVAAIRRLYEFGIEL